MVEQWPRQERMRRRQVSGGESGGGGPRKRMEGWIALAGAGKQAQPGRREGPCRDA